ncbi:MAG: Gfo/Idh/MocA family oxidoreductase [Anaeroplasmataceae bacterium]|nr:Gfo/Idh/MocA family oxidoreductase [Anaeroplasmataceae bacterium]
MKKVITYGTYDLLHHGHIRLLERAKELGDYLIVGVTADDFDKSRGKINVTQSLSERIEAVRQTGLADEIIVEEYSGQKIDDIRKYNVDIFTVGSDWIGMFDYLKEYCEVIYLDRTTGISSTDLRGSQGTRIGLIGGGSDVSNILLKYFKESTFVNGLVVSGVCSKDTEVLEKLESDGVVVFKDYQELLSHSDAVYIVSEPEAHYVQIKKALEAGKHVLCESPITINKEELQILLDLAQKKNLILMDAIKTAYATAYHRLLLLAKTKCIGDIVSVDTTCTSLKDPINDNFSWNSITSWGPTALLPIFQILGTNYISSQIVSKFMDKDHKIDLMTKVAFVYPNAVASIKVGKGVKSEGELIITGNKGCIYVPAPWWKTDYFEIHYENLEDNKKYFYQLDGEGIRYVLIAFVQAIRTGKGDFFIETETSKSIVSVMDDFYSKKYLTI